MSKMMERGDIWEMETAGGDVMDALILACFRTHAEGIMLTPVAPLEHGVKVRSAAWVWADCSRISHINYKYRLRRVRSLDASEMERVIDGIARAFGLAPLRLIPQEGGTS